MLIEAVLECNMLVQGTMGGHPHNMYDRVVKAAQNPDLRREGDTVVWTGPTGQRHTARWLGLTETDDPAPTPTEAAPAREDEPASGSKGTGRAGKTGRRPQAR